MCPEHDPADDSESSPGRVAELPEKVRDMIDGGGAAKPISQKVHHGSPTPGLKTISADPPVARQFDNGTSQLGAFVAVDREDSERYAGDGGVIYDIDLSLETPFQMPLSLFSYLQDPTKDQDGNGLSGDEWAGRLTELVSEGRAIRDELESKGHDGVVIADRRGNIMEIASFADLHMTPSAAPEQP